MKRTPHSPQRSIFRLAAALSIVLSIAVLCGCAAKSSDVRIDFITETPADTPANATVYLSGSREELGKWSADALPMQRLDDHTFEQSVIVPSDAELEYKFTLGSWEQVEVAADGNDMANRKLKADWPKTVKSKVSRWAKGKVKRASTITGDVRPLTNFKSKALPGKRAILIYFPPGYDDDSDRRYPVLYMHDGQNCFDDATSFAGEWNADETAQRLIEAGQIEPIIIVAVANAGEKRMYEYTPSADVRFPEGGGAARYGKFLVEELKPFVDSQFNTDPRREVTGVCGSSLGGLVSLWLAQEYPKEIGKCAALSPSLWWNGHEMIAAIKKSPNWAKSCRIWFDMGTAEVADVDDNRPVAETRALARILSAAGLARGRDYQYIEVLGASHNEAAWSKRFDQVLRFLYPAKKPTTRASR